MAHELRVRPLVGWGHSGGEEEAGASDIPLLLSPLDIEGEIVRVTAG